MKVTDDLFQLIKSLSQSEKRFFKVYSSLHHVKGDDNKYLKLFNAIEKQKTYDEELIRKQFGNEKFLKQLFVVKNYLYHIILKCLRVYNSEKTKQSELIDLLKDIQSLYDKSLYKQCRKFLEKAKRIAYDYEIHSQILTVLDWEKKLARTNSYAGIDEKEMIEIYNEHNETTKNLVNINEYWKLTMKSFLLIKKHGDLRNKADFKKFNELIKHPLLRSEKQATTFLSKTFYLNIKGLYYITNKDYKSLLTYCLKLVEISEKNPLLMSEDNYIAALHNLLIVQIELKKYEDALLTFKKLRELDTKSLSTRSRIFNTTYDMELNLYLKTGEFEKGIPLITEIEEGLKRYKGRINRESEVMFAYNIAYLLFANGYYEKSLKYLNEIINDKELSIREDIQCFARILNLLVQYEMGNYDLIGHIKRSTLRYLSNKNKLNKFELITLNYIRQLVSANIDDDKMFIFNKWRKELKAISDDMLEIKAYEYFDFMSWLESKMGKKSFAEVVKEKRK